MHAKNAISILVNNKNKAIQRINTAIDKQDEKYYRYINKH